MAENFAEGDGVDDGAAVDPSPAEAWRGADAGAAPDGEVGGASGDGGGGAAEVGTGTSAVGGTFPGGAVLRRGSTGWVLAEERPERALGGALVWATRTHIEQLHVLAEGEEAAGVLARRAGAFRRPPQVWTISGRRLRPAATAAPLLDRAPSEADLRFAAMFASAGAEAVVEHGVLVAEVLGLEVGRVVEGRLDVGVGKHDREAQRLVHGDRPPEESLRAAVAAVREVRRAGAPVHEMNRLAQERWLRSVVMANPQMVGATSLTALPEPVSRQGLRMAAPAPAAGIDLKGGPVVVVCSTGIDVDLVPTAADARKLAERRIYPAIDVNASSTRHEELLFERNQLQQVWKLRRVLNALASEGSAANSLELLMDKIKATRSNDEFLSEIAKGPAAGV